MNNKNKKRSALQHYISNQSGSMAMVWGLCITTIIMVSGAGYDISQVTRSKAEAQLWADSIALSASVAVNNSNKDRFIEGKSYTVADLGGEVTNVNSSIRANVAYDIPDSDGERLLARATVKGNYKMAFYPFIGSGTIEYEATSDVAYAQDATSPASILLILDNSGSMAWDDDTGTRKIVSLKSTINSFMQTLNTLTVDETPKVLRTGMMSYSSAGQTGQVYECKDEQVYVQDSKGYWTRKTVHGHLKWVWVHATGHYETKSVCKYNTRTVTDSAAVFFRNSVSMNWGIVEEKNITDMYAKGGTDPSGALKRGKKWLKTEGKVHNKENGTNDPLKFVVFMTDGSNNSSSITTNSLSQCTQMKKAGITIYTVGYALKAGYPKQDGKSLYSYYIYQSEVTKAKSFLSKCASDSDHYVLAKNADDLEDVFKTIGKDIAAEVIRIKS